MSGPVTNLMISQSTGALGTTGLGPRQKELQELQRAYRFMEMHRRDYSEESQRLLKKQQSTIDMLIKQNKEIKNEINLITRKSNRPMSETQQDAINKLIDMSEKYSKVIEFETENTSTMQEQIAIMHHKVFLQRKTMGGINASKDNILMIQKQIRILENRLDKALLKYNEAIAGNKELRDNIDDLRRERVVFETIYKKMERQLSERKSQMSAIIENSNLSYEQRDSHQMEIAAIEQANRKEEEEFTQQCNELSHMLENELKLPTSTTNSPVKNNSSMKNLFGHNNDHISTTMNPTLASRSINSNSNNYSINNNADIATARVQNFEEAFNKIRNATGITDIDELVKNFIKNEDHNFSLFNYVSEQNTEIEKIEEVITNLKEEEKRYLQDTGDDVDSHKLLLKELELKLSSKELAAEKYEDKCKVQMKLIEALKRGCHSIYYKFDLFSGTSHANEEELLNDVSRVRETFITESNMVHYLGEIEQKTNKLLVDYANVKDRLYGPPPSLKTKLNSSINLNVSLHKTPLVLQLLLESMTVSHLQERRLFLC